MAALAERYVQGVSTRKVKAITARLAASADLGGRRGAARRAGTASPSAISAINTRLDEGLAEFAGRRLVEACRYLILDARYERVREAGVIRSQAVLLAIGIGWHGRRSILAVELANRESRSSWRDFLQALRQRGLSGVEFVVSDDQAGLRRGDRRGAARGRLAALLRALPAQRRDYVPRKVDHARLATNTDLGGRCGAACLRELRWLYDRRDLTEARRDLAAWLAKWQATYPKLCGWVEEHIEARLAPRDDHQGRPGAAH